MGIRRHEMMRGWVNLAQIGPFLRAQRWCMPRMGLLGLITLAPPFSASVY
jgi:hypothetical protein